jgi:hypothetical protein
MSEIDLLIKLFDTLKDSSKETQDLCRAMLTNQTKIGGAMQGIPFDEIKTMLKDHAKESSKEIDTCSETVEMKTDGIMEEVKALGNKVNRMILVVVVSFSIMTGGFFLIRYAAEQSVAPPDNWEERLRAIEEDQHEDIDNKLNKFMDEIRNEMRRLHPEKK